MLYAELHAKTNFSFLEGASHPDELVRRAAELSNFMRPMARLFYAASRLGARVSPLHGRFKIPIRSAALAEAASLTKERVSLIKQ